MVKPLILSGVVNREVNLKDKRAYKLKLNKKIIPFLPEIKERVTKWKLILENGLTDNERTILHKCLDIMEQNAFNFLKGENN